MPSRRGIFTPHCSCTAARSGSEGQSIIISIGFFEITKASASKRAANALLCGNVSAAFHYSLQIVEILHHAFAADVHIHRGRIFLGKSSESIAARERP